MFRRISSLLILLFFISSLMNRTVQAEDRPHASIFDVKQEKVVRVLPITPALEASVIEVLLASPTLFGGYSVDPNDGLVVHFPFASPVHVIHKLYPNTIREIYLFLEHGKKIRALIFFASSKQSPIVVDLNDDASKFMERNKL